MFKSYKLQTYVVGFVLAISIISIASMNIFLSLENKKLKDEIALNRSSVILERINVNLRNIIEKLDSGKIGKKELDRFSADEKLFLIKIYNSQKKLIYQVRYFPIPSNVIKKLDPKRSSGELPSRGDFFFYRYSMYLSGYIDTLVCFYPIFDKYNRVKYYIYYITPTPFRFPSDTLTQLIALSQVVFVMSIIAIIVYFLRRLLRPYENIIKEVKESKVVTSDVNKAQDEVDFVFSSFKEIISRLKEKEKELKKLHEAEKKRADTIEKFFKDFIEGIDIGIFTFDEKGVFRDGNSRGFKIFKRQRIFFKNRSFKQIFSEMDEVVEAFDGVFNGKKPGLVDSVEINEKIWRITILPYFTSTGEFNGVISIFEDVTEVSRLKERLTIQKQLSQIGEMSAGIAHEFKNSLATISGYLQMVEGEDKKYIDGRRYKYLMDEVENLNKVVVDFLDFAKPMELSGEKFNVCEVIEELLERKEDILKKYEVNFLKEDCFEIKGDRYLFLRALENILENSVEAIKLNSNGRISIRVYGNERKIIEIEDNGCGIASQNLSKIFTPFFTTKSDGVGMGLSLVQKIVVLHSGNIEVDSKEGEGTIVRIIFYSEEDLCI